MGERENLEKALAKARRTLSTLVEQAAGYTSLTIPAHLKGELEDKREEVADLEARLEKLAAQTDNNPASIPVPSNKLLYPVIALSVVAIVAVLSIIAYVVSTQPGKGTENITNTATANTLVSTTVSQPTTNLVRTNFTQNTTIANTISVVTPRLLSDLARTPGSITQATSLNATNQARADVFSVAFHPNGKVIASASGALGTSANNPGEVNVWKIGSDGLPVPSEKISLPGIKSAATWLAFSKDGKYLVTATYDGTIRVWDVTPEGLPDINSSKELNSDTNNIAGVAISSNGKYVAVPGNNTILIFDTSTSKKFKTLTRLTDSAISLAFSPQDDNLLLSGGSSGRVTTWDITNEVQIKTFSNTGSQVQQVAFSPDGKIVAAGGKDGFIRLWDSRTYALLWEQGNLGIVETLAFSPDGKIVAIGSDNRMIKLYDVATGNLLDTLTGHTSFINTVAFNPAGTLLISGSANTEHQIKVWH